MFQTMRNNILLSSFLKREEIMFQIIIYFELTFSNFYILKKSKIQTKIHMQINYYTEQFKFALFSYIFNFLLFGY